MAITNGKPGPLPMLKVGAIYFVDFISPTLGEPGFCVDLIGFEIAHEKKYWSWRWPIGFYEHGYDLSDFELAILPKSLVELITKVPKLEPV